MSQTSTERLRDYLVQLPPQSQALLMREFERAIERGEDATVANFVLEQLRKVVRGSDDEAQPRTNDPARLLFRPLEPFLVEANFPMRPGRVRRASLLPVWQWLIAMARLSRRANSRRYWGRRARAARRPISNLRSANCNSQPLMQSSRLPRRRPAATSSARWPASVRPM